MPYLSRTIGAKNERAGGEKPRRPVAGSGRAGRAHAVYLRHPGAGLPARKWSGKRNRSGGYSSPFRHLIMMVLPGRLSSRLLKNYLRGLCGVKNGLKMLIYSSKVRFFVQHR